MLSLKNHPSHRSKPKSQTSYLGNFYFRQDTAGQEKYNAVAPVYYRDAVGAIIVYDITSTESFQKVKKWVEELRNHANKKNITIVIVGNKSDLEAQRRV